MKEYITRAVIALFSGFIGLSKDQAARRSTALKKVRGKKDTYEIIQPVEFKAGEVIVIDPDKATLARLELTEDVLAKEAAENQKLLEQIMKDTEELDELKAKTKPTKKELARIEELETILKEE